MCYVSVEKWSWVNIKPLLGVYVSVEKWSWVNIKPLLGVYVRRGKVEFVWSTSNRF